MPTLILSRTRPSLRWERISVSHSIATAASPTAAKEPDKYRCLIGAMSAHGTKRTSQWRQLMSALWGKSEMKRKRRHFRFCKAEVAPFDERSVVSQNTAV